MQTIEHIIRVLTQFNINDEPLMGYYAEKFAEIEQKLKTEQKTDLLSLIEKGLEKKGSKARR